MHKQWTDFRAAQLVTGYRTDIPLQPPLCCDAMCDAWGDRAGMGSTVFYSSDRHRAEASQRYHAEGNQSNIDLNNGVTVSENAGSAHDIVDEHELGSEHGHVVGEHELEPEHGHVADDNQEEDEEVVSEAQDEDVQADQAEDPDGSDDDDDKTNSNTRQGWRARSGCKRKTHPQGCRLWHFFYWAMQQLINKLRKSLQVPA